MRRSGSALLVVLAASAAACGDGSPPPPVAVAPEPPVSEAGEPASPPPPWTPEEDAAARASCAAPLRYFATLLDASCADVDADAGTWAAFPTFPDAPDDVKLASCTYQWRPRRADAPPDATALDRALGGSKRAAACGEAAEPLDVPAREVPFGIDPGTAGSPGCDVCGLVRFQRMYLVFPETDDRLRAIEVRLSDGTSRYFVPDTDRPVAAASVRLPAAPPGLAYRPGRVLYY